jgi:O-antigen ligase
MLNSPAEGLVTRILAIGAGFTTIFIVSGVVTDPVNVPKLLSIGVTGIAAISVLIFSELRKRIVHFKFVFVTLVVFIFFSFLSVFASSAPLSQSFYGVYGRNNGALTYFLLVIFFLAALTIRAIKNFKSIIFALLFAGYVNIIYCLWVLMFGDFIGWSNPYGNILGTLGNPNFIGSFLGIFLSVFVAVAIGNSSSIFYRYGALIIIPVTSYEIFKSQAIQGRVVAALGIGIVGFYYIKSRFANHYLWIYSILCTTIGGFSILGALQVGPLTDLIYKTSVSLRGQYWLSGLNAGKTHPFTGVGMDSLGDWYRRTRDAHALVLPGPDTVVNAAHNVVLDMFAFGGFPLLVSYVALIAFVFVAILKLSIRSKNFDPTLVALVVAWIGYQAQSIISINQIGLAVWGWLLSGAIIAYEHVTRTASLDVANSVKSGRVNTLNGQNSHLTMVAILGAILGIITALPPLTADSKWRSAMVTLSVSDVEVSMARSYFNPANVHKYLSNIKVLESSQLHELSHKYALQAVSWNADVFESWKMLYLLKNTTEQEKLNALSNMKRLDPLNAEVTKLN